MKPQYLRVKNWEKFQHYKDRRPPWIKFHVELLDDHGLSALPLTAQLVYDRLLLWAAKTDNNIEHDPLWLSGKINIPPDVIQEGIETLVVAGFLAIAGRKRHASKAIAKRSGDASEPPTSATSETEAEAETETHAETETEAETASADFTRTRATKMLLDVLNDADSGTKIVVRSMIENLRLSEGDVIAAREAALGKGVRSRTAVAVSELKKRGEARAA